MCITVAVATMQIIIFFLLFPLILLLKLKEILSNVLDIFIKQLLAYLLTSRFFPVPLLTQTIPQILMSIFYKSVVLMCAGLKFPIEIK